MQSNSSILRSLQMITPLIRDLNVEDCFVALTDLTTFIAYEPGEKLDIEVKVGEKFRKGGMNDSVIQTGQRVVRHVPKGIYKIPYVAVGIPVFEEKKIVGCLTMCVSTDREERIHEMAETLDQAVSHIVKNTEDLATGSKGLSDVNERLNDAMTDANEALKEIVGVTSFLKGLTRQTTILGFNASIEAARAGEYGKSFGVVADEIRKFATTTDEATGKITLSMGETEKSMLAAQEETKETQEYTNQQDAKLQEMLGVTQELKALTSELREMASLINESRSSEAK
ncbi:methyl-accepting chemotaxis protein [Salipaludibacillus daqingensis]|uniref:methyl-accepting chemotaxis protein n=1 Tax=Salipaludibacillus daqingensis TaxID=3041001 RepID=UPI0024760DC9|nr:methyl-accepting chemotaxis protein [Salipaludibacillus daqingensis]